MHAGTDKDAEANTYVRQSARDLFRDRDLIDSGWQPRLPVFANAPLIEDWQAIEHAPSAEWPQGSTTLTGPCFGHSFFDDGHYVETCALAFWDGRRFARTQTDWWRLGEPKKPSIHDMTTSRCPPPDDDYVTGWPL
jgi:hypothetical protein